MIEGVKRFVMRRRLLFASLAVWFFIAALYFGYELMEDGPAGFVRHLFEEAPLEHFIITLYLPLMVFVGWVSDGKRRTMEQLAATRDDLSTSNRQLGTTLGVVQAVDLWASSEDSGAPADEERVRAGLAALADGLGASGLALVCEGVEEGCPIVVSEGVPADIMSGLAACDPAAASFAAASEVIGPTAVVGVKVSGAPYGVLWAMRPPGASAFSEIEHGTLAAAGSYLAAALRAADLERRRAQLARTHEALFEHSVDAVLVSDLDGRVIRVNAAAEQLTGYSSDELMGMDLGRLTAAALRGRRIMSSAAELKEAGTQVFDWPLRRADGVVITAEVKAHLIEEAGAELVQSIVRDVTDTRRVEEEKNEFIGVVSHEVRTPLTSIGGFARLLLERDGMLDEATRISALRHISAQADRLTRMTRDMLSLARMNAGKSPFEKTEEIDVREAAQRALDLVSVTSQRHRFELAVGGDDARVEANPDALESVLVNLLSNAVKYSPDGGVVEVEVLPSERDVAVEVRDHGIGIASSDFEQVFNRFMRLGNGRATGACGVGLGLHIVRGLMQAMGGDIEVRSGERAGSVFRFAVPRRRRRIAAVA